MNIIIIVVDALRPDVLPFYGGDLQTPHLEDFANESILFEQHFTHVATTLPSHTSLFSSLYPREHGITMNGLMVPQEIPTLAGTLQNAGYETAGFISAAVLHSDYGIDKGFETWDDNMSSRHQLNEVAGPKILSDEVTERAVNWLSHRDNDQPFFLFMHYFDPHTPENIPEPWLSMYPRPNYLIERILYHKLGYKNISPYKILAQRNSWYDGAVTYTDKWIGRLIEFLKQQNLSDEAMILITADHGEANGDHDYAYHNVYLYDEFVHIPLLLKLPFQKYAGEKVSGLTEHIDIMPTLIDAVQNSKKPKNLSGDSWWHSLQNGDPVGKVYVFGQRQYFDPGHEFVDLRGKKHIVQGMQHYLRSDRYKLIVEENGNSELYALDVDSKELENIADKQPEITQQLQEVLNEMKKKHTPRFDPIFHNDEITIQRLKDLGYMD